jgi:hypothetical protein
MCEGIERRMTPFSVGFRLTTSLRRVEPTARRGGNSLAGTAGFADPVLKSR